MSTTDLEQPVVQYIGVIDDDGNPFVWKYAFQANVGSTLTRSKLRCLSATGYDDSSDPYRQTWGYHGSGARDLAYSLIADLVPENQSVERRNAGETIAWHLCHDLKEDVIAKLPYDGIAGEAFMLTAVMLNEWIRLHGIIEAGRDFHWIAEAWSVPRLDKPHTRADNYNVRYNGVQYAATVIDEGMDEQPGQFALWIASENCGDEDEPMPKFFSVPWSGGYDLRRMIAEVIITGGLSDEK